MCRTSRARRVTLHRQTALARDAGLRMVMVAPMLVGLPAFAELVATFPDMAFLGHPALGGAWRIAPELLFGKLFRLAGADAVIFVNHGGRFGYTPAQCRSLADNLRNPWGGLAPAFPVPSGGMTVERVPEIVRFYGPDTLLLVSGDLFGGQSADAGYAAGWPQPRICASCALPLHICTHSHSRAASARTPPRRWQQVNELREPGGDRDDQLVTVASLYYELNQNQQQIAERMEISRSSVSRMIKEARERGIVEIRIHRPIHRDYRLEQGLIEVFGLQDALRAAHHAELRDEQMLYGVGRLAAGYLERVFATLPCRRLHRHCLGHGRPRRGHGARRGPQPPDRRGADSGQCGRGQFAHRRPRPGAHGRRKTGRTSL